MSFYRFKWLFSLVLICFPLHLLFASPPAAIYEIKAQIFINGKLIAQPRIITQEGEKSELVQTLGNNEKSLHFTVTAHTQKHPNMGEAIALKMNIDYQQGKVKLHTQPQVLVPAGTPAKITQKAQGDQSELLLNISALRK